MRDLALRAGIGSGGPTVTARLDLEPGPNARPLSRLPCIDDSQ